MSNFHFNQSECVICRETLSSRICTTIPCGHTFHAICLERYLSGDTRCPTCRIEIIVNPDDDEEIVEDRSAISSVGLLMLIMSKLSVLEEKIDEIGDDSAFRNEFQSCFLCGADIRKSRLQRHTRKCIKSFPIKHLAKQCRNNTNTIQNDNM